MKTSLSTQSSSSSSAASSSACQSFREPSLSEWESALDRAEEAMRRISGQCRLQKTGHPDVFCSTLPSHWRSNKSLPTPFVVLAFFPVPDGTRVCVSAGNDENFSADVKNNMAEFNGQMARFSDLRFVGKSGRGKNFNLSITIFTQPHAQMIVVPNVVKVTVDGPRDSRNASKYASGQYIPIPKRIRSGTNLDQLHASRKNNTSRNAMETTSKPPGLANFLFDANLPTGLPPLPPFLPPMTAALNGLFPRINGQLAAKLGAINPTSIAAATAAMGFRPPMFRLPFGSGNPLDAATAQIATARLFGLNNLPNSLPIGHPPRLPLFGPTAAMPTSLFNGGISLNAKTATTAAPIVNNLFSPTTLAAFPNSASLLAAMMANTAAVEKLGNGLFPLSAQTAETRANVEAEEERRSLPQAGNNIQHQTEAGRNEEGVEEKSDEASSSTSSDNSELPSSRKRSRTESCTSNDDSAKRSKPTEPQNNPYNMAQPAATEQVQPNSLLSEFCKTAAAALIEGRLALTRPDNQQDEEEGNNGSSADSATTALPQQQHNSGLWRPYHL